MVKLLHTADLHLDSPLRTLALRDPDLKARVEMATRGALTRIVDIALEEEVAALLIAGDLYDGGQRSMKTAAFLVAQFQRLADAGIHVFIVRGNHDAESRITAEIGWPANVRVFDGRGRHEVLDGTGIAIHGVSFAKPHAPESLVGRFRPVEGLVNIALMHTSLGGAPGHDAYAPCSLADLAVAGFDYWALGHIHRRAVHHEHPFVVMPGMPQGRDIGEDGPKSATLIHVGEDGLRIEERPTAGILFLRADCDVGGAREMADVLAAVRRAISGAAGAVPVVVRLRLTGRTDLTWQIRRDLDLITAMAAEAGAPLGVWIDRILAETALPQEAPDPGAAGELAALITEIAARPGFEAEALAAVAEVVEDLPAALRGAYGDDQAARLAAVRRLITEAADYASARTHGAGRGGD